MKRRRLLAGLAAVPSVGCVSPANSSPAETDGSTHPEITVLAATIDPPNGMDVAVVVGDQFSPDTPATLEITMTNGSDGDLTVESGPTLPISPLVGKQRDGAETALVLPADGMGYQISGEDTEPGDVEVRTPAETARNSLRETRNASRDRNQSQRPQDGCWRAPPGRLTVYAMARGQTLSPDQSVARSYVVVAGSNNDGCLQRGVYEFEDDLRIDGEPASMRIDLRVQ